MFRVIFAAQAIVYLLVAPLIKELELPYYNSPLIFGIIAIGSLFFGMSISQKNNVDNTINFETNNILLPITVALGLVYCAVSFYFGLLNRRIGSEIIAEVYSNLPFWALVVIKVYEMFLVPAIILIVFGNRKISNFQYVVLFFTALISIPFMGISDSRSKLLILVLSFLIFVRLEFVKSALRKSLTLYIAVALAVSAFVFVSVERATQYARSSDFYISEVVERLDGLALVKDLNDSGAIKTFGNYDGRMVYPLQSKIPFFEEGRYLKSVAKTSTKQYYLQDILNTQKLDSFNSMVTDPIYFGGFPLLIFSFVLLGYLISKFDNTVATQGLFTSRLRTTLLFSFGTSFLLIESDYVGAIANFLQIFPLFYAISHFALRKRDVSSITDGFVAPQSQTEVRSYNRSSFSATGHVGNFNP